MITKERENYIDVPFHGLIFKQQFVFLTCRVKLYDVAVRFFRSHRQIY